MSELFEFNQNIPSSPEVDWYESKLSAIENGESSYETMFVRFKASVKQKLGNTAKKLLGGWDGRDYLDVHDDEYIDAMAHITKLLGNPRGDEFEARLQAHARDIEENRRINYKFDMRMPAIAYRQASRDENTGRSIPMITRTQAGMLYWYRDDVEKLY